MILLLVILLLILIVVLLYLDVNLLIWSGLAFISGLLLLIGQSNEKVVTGGSQTHVDPEIIAYVLHNVKPKLSHLPKDAKQAQAFTRLITDDAPTKTYESRSHEFKHVLHWGQLKLMLSEIEFLTLVVGKLPTSEPKKKVICVYAGAAPGIHTKYLSELFPDVYFELYDPAPFSITDSSHISIHNEYFTDRIASEWSESKDYVVFITDIRTEPATDENIVVNMQMQLKWWQIMRPRLSMFKFRLPWRAGFTEYPDGKIYVQCYPGATSSETRLIVERDAPIVKYNNKHYEDQLFYHNVVTRKQRFTTGAGDLVFDQCYDCTAFVHIVTDYLTMTTGKEPNEQEVKDLCKRIQNECANKQTVKSKTQYQFNEALDSYDIKYETRGNTVVPTGKYPDSKAKKSIATIEGYTTTNSTD